MLRNFLQKNFTRKVSEERSYIAAADGIRGLAVLSIIFGHTSVYLLVKSATPLQPTFFEIILGNVFCNPGIGLHIFFVLSGFLLILPFAQHHLGIKQQPSVANYFARRLVRLELPYIVALTVSSFVLIFILKNFSFSYLFPRYITSLFYGNLIVYGTTPEPLPVAWSLEAEIQFYILVPLLAYVFKLKALLRRTLLVVLMLAIPTIIHYTNSSIRIHFLHQSQYFFAGILAVDFYITRPHKKYTTLFYNCMAVVVFSIFIWFIPLLWQSVYMEKMLSPIFIALFVYLVIGKEVGRSIFCNIYVKSLGLMSYTVYLWHYMVISLILRFTISFTDNNQYISIVKIFIQGCIVLPFLLLLSTMLFLLIEKPCMYSKAHKRIVAFFKGQ